MYSMYVYIRMGVYILKVLIVVIVGWEYDFFCVLEIFYNKY